MPSMLKDDPLKKAYVPIDTDLVDDLEHYASDQIPVHLEYKDRDGEVKSMRGLIADVYTTKDSEEFLKMMDGRSLRLDQLVTIRTRSKSKADTFKDEALDLEMRLHIEENKFFPGGLS